MQFLLGRKISCYTTADTPSLANRKYFFALTKWTETLDTKWTSPLWLDVLFCFYLSSVVHHEISASHSIGALSWRDPKMITAGVPHGEETERVPPLVCPTQRRLFHKIPRHFDRKQQGWQTRQRYRDLTKQTKPIRLRLHSLTAGSDYLMSADYEYSSNLNTLTEQYQNAKCSYSSLTSALFYLR